MKQHEPKRRTLLLIDDDPLVHRVLSRMVSEQWDVVGAHDASTARGILQSGAVFDAILCDVHLGRTDSGLAIYEDLLAVSIDEAQKLIILTGTTPQTEDAIGESLTCRWMMKPPKKSELLAALAAVATASDAAVAAEAPRASRAPTRTSAAPGGNSSVRA